MKTSEPRGMDKLLDGVFVSFSVAVIATIIYCCYLIGAIIQEFQLLRRFS